MSEKLICSICKKEILKNSMAIEIIIGETYEKKNGLFILKQRSETLHYTCYEVLSMNLTIQIDNHLVLSNQKIIEIRKHRKLIATIIPRETNISITSEYIKDFKLDINGFPPKLIIELTNIKKTKIK